MKKTYHTTIEESIETHFRIAELLGTVRTLKWIGLVVAPIIPISLFFLIDNLAASLIIGVTAAGLFVLHHLSTYKKNVRKRIRKTLVRAMGPDEPVPSEYEMDESGLVYKALGQEIKFSWSNAQDFTCTGDSIEIIMAPIGIAMIPNRIFENTREFDQWMKFIEDHIQV